MSTDTVSAPSPILAPRSADSRWYQDAVIYQVHIRSFCDSSGDGMGDVRGLTGKLDYIQSLGVSAIWLLPFFPSPLKDDGYDIADYKNINPAYGTLKDFERLLHEAKRRDLRIITELVMNHTSDQHAWFQRSRRARPGTKWREYYVWSDTPDRYRDARIIFQDFETSNWTWDPVAEAYFWHRFYSHQPDLNFDNPEVHDAMLDTIDFWLEMGVDGVRLDAVPYLYEREGTNCENLPETHAFLRKLRAHVDRKFSDKMLLAEANQWPEDAAAYFGNGDECHMNFHFPLMPRLFMALEREDHFPITDILEQTPPLPDGCQWGIFLRNHDELTLEMVTDEERDYMYRAYARDPRARINLGIRRRLAPLLQNNRRKIELMTGLLLSLPGTPIIYYGDELGMGDNIYLGDRDGVRTPMQWSPDRNAGFSRCNPQRLCLPVIIDAEYHFATVNVEVQEDSPHSMLWTTRRLVQLRNNFRAFGRGDFRVLTPENAKVLAFLRSFEDEVLLVVANLSRFAQCCELDLAEFRGQRPVELFGKTVFPPIGELPYFLTLGPHALYWFQLKWPEEENIDISQQELPTMHVRGEWTELFEGRGKTRLESFLPAFLARDRWFGSKRRRLTEVQLIDTISLTSAEDELDYWLLLTSIKYTEGEPETYLIPVVLAEQQQSDAIRGDHPGAGIVTVIPSATQERRTLCDASWEPQLWRALAAVLAGQELARGRNGVVELTRTTAMPEPGCGPNTEQVSLYILEHRNPVANLGDSCELKIFRDVTPGTNPDFELGRHLTEREGPRVVPDVYAALEYRSELPDLLTLALLRQHCPSHGDVWHHTLDELGRSAETWQGLRSEAGPLLPPEGKSLVALASEPTPAVAHDIFGNYLLSMELLGQRTAEFHIAMSEAEDDDRLVPKPFTKLYQRSLYQSIRSQLRQAFAALRKSLQRLPAHHECALEVLECEGLLLDRVREVLSERITAMRIRCHQDFNLRHVLYTGKDFVLINLEGEPGRPFRGRRTKTSPLRDVAGMIGSLHYASHAALLGRIPGAIAPREGDQSLENFARSWFFCSAASFLRAYLQSMQAAPHILPDNERHLEALLNAHLLEGACSALLDELNPPTDWIGAPLTGLLKLRDLSVTSQE